jgi:hypothetical protein
MLISEIKPMIQACHQADDCLLISGVHGIGKSQIAEQWANENNIHMETLFLSHQEVGDLIGMPRTIERDGEIVTMWTKPIWLQRLDQASENGQETAIFLDELNRAPQDILQSALQLVLERKIHQHKLPTTSGQRTTIISAINPPELYMTSELDPALLDRFCYVDVEVDVEGWLKYGREKKINQMVLDFIIENPTRLHFMPDEGSDEKVSASPRSWEKLAALVNTFSKIPESIHYPLIKGKIGSAVGAQFYQFMLNYSKVVKIEDIEKVAKQAWKKTKDIEKVAEFVKELTEKMEAIGKNEMTHTLCSKYLVKDATTEDCIPVLGMLYSLEIETLASVLKELSKGNEEQLQQFQTLTKVDFNKEIFKKITRKTD